mgnify:CR=1 FL=1
MPCGRCNEWIDGEWIHWRRCFADPIADNRILVHTSLWPPKDKPLLIYLVLSDPGSAHWFFFCRNCRHHLRTRNFRIRLMTMVTQEDEQGALGRPVFTNLHLHPTNSSVESWSTDSSDSNPWIDHLEFWYSCQSLVEGMAFVTAQALPGRILGSKI